MPVPKRKRSRARRDSRFANKGIEVKSFASCNNCAAPITSHRICSTCGYYKGRKVMVTKLDRSGKRQELMAARKATLAAKEAAAETPDQNA
jgi:large subunit ribosomal protein L32